MFCIWTILLCSPLLGAFHLETIKKNKLFIRYTHTHSMTNVGIVKRKSFKMIFWLKEVHIQTHTHVSTSLIVTLKLVVSKCRTWFSLAFIINSLEIFKCILSAPMIKMVFNVIKAIVQNSIIFHTYPIYSLTYLTRQHWLKPKPLIFCASCTIFCSTILQVE